MTDPPTPFLPQRRELGKVPEDAVRAKRADVSVLDAGGRPEAAAAAPQNRRAGFIFCGN
jgi:hypothetical protein